MKRLKHLPLLLLVLVPFACKKGGCNIIPNVSFRSFVQQSALAVPGSFVLAEGGYAGLLVVYTNNGIKAYDRCSTVNPGQRNAIVVDEGGLTASDPVSGAKYILMNGSPVNVAECPLKEYFVSPQGNLTYIIEY